MFRDDTLRYEETHTVRGYREVSETWMGDQVPYTVTAAVVDDPREATVTTSEIERMVRDWGESECFEVSFTVYETDVGSFLGALEDCPESTSS